MCASLTIRATTHNLAASGEKLYRSSQPACLPFLGLNAHYSVRLAVTRQLGLPKLLFCLPHAVRERTLRRLALIAEASRWPKVRLWHSGRLLELSHP